MRSLARVAILFLSLTDVWLCTLPLVWVLTNIDWFLERDYFVPYLACLIFAGYSLYLGIATYAKSDEYDEPPRG